MLGIFWPYAITANISGNYLGTPYSSYDLNNFYPLQSGSSIPSGYVSQSSQSADGCVVNVFQNRYEFGCGGSVSLPGNPGAVIFTLTNSVAGNSI